MRRCFISVGLRAMIAPLLTLATAATGDEPPRQLGAHEHGHGYLDIALDGDKVVIELQAPGSEVVVSKAAPGSDERKRDADAAVQTLERADALFRLSQAAGCSLISAKAHVTVVGGGGDHGAALKPDNVKGGEQGKEPGKAHGGEKGHQGHRDYHGSYSFTCAAPGKLAEVSLAYFETFPNAGRLTIQLIGPKGQTQIVATRASATVGLSGVN